MKPTVPWLAEAILRGKTAGPWSYPLTYTSAEVENKYDFFTFCWPCISIHLCNKNQLDTLFTLSLFRQSTSTCLWHICSPSSGGILYIYNKWYVLCFSVDFFFLMPPHVHANFCGPPSWLWRNCNRLLSLGRPWGAVTLSRWCFSWLSVGWVEMKLQTVNWTAPQVPIVVQGCW